MHDAKHFKGVWQIKYYELLGLQLYHKYYDFLKHIFSEFDSADVGRSGDVPRVVRRVSRLD